MNEKTFNVTASRIAQKKYCEEKGYPHFAPGSGVCYNCKQNIYIPIQQKCGDREYTTGIDVERAGGHITGCPHCNRSYCD